MTLALPSALTRALAFALERFFSVDLRTLALFRVAFGLFLLGNLYDRTRGPNGVAFFTDDGLLPGYALLEAPISPRTWSLMFAFSTPGEVRVALLCVTLVYLAYLVGWHTRAMQWLVVAILVSLDNRSLFLQNGGVVVANVAALLTAFLPLGERYSVDALRRANPRAPRESVVRLAYGVLVLDFAAMYLFNALHKNGATWHDGSAVHWVLWQNRVATPFAGWLRLHEPAWFSPLATRGTVITEGALALLIVSPVAQRWTRRVALALCLGLHGGIALLMELGPFSYAMMCIALLLLRPADWDAVGGFLRPRFGAWKVRAAVRLRSVVGPQTAPGEYAPDPRAVPPPPSALAGAARAGLRDAATILLATCMAVQLLHDNWILPGSLRIANRPEFVGLVIDYLRIPQGWMMFAPEAPRDDGTLVVDGVLADDTHVDPFTGRAPDFEQALHGPLDYGQSWCDYFLRISWDDNRRYWPYLRDYLLRAQRVGLKVATPLKRFDVYWVSNQAPQPGSVTPHDLRRKLLFSGNARGGRR